MSTMMDGQPMQMFDGFMKRDGMVVPFRRDKIVQAISRAAEEVALRMFLIRWDSSRTTRSKCFGIPFFGAKMSRSRFRSS